MVTTDLTNQLVLINCRDDSTSSNSKSTRVVTPITMANYMGQEVKLMRVLDPDNELQKDLPAKDTLPSLHSQTFPV